MVIPLIDYSGSLLCSQGGAETSCIVKDSTTVQIENVVRFGRNNVAMDKEMVAMFRKQLATNHSASLYIALPHDVRVNTS